MYCCPKDLSCRRAAEQSCWSGLAELVGVEAQDVGSRSTQPLNVTISKQKC